MRTELRLYIFAVALLAVLLTTHLVQMPQILGSQEMLLGTFLAALITLAGVYQIHLSPRTLVNVNTAAFFLVILVFSPLVAVLVSALGIAAVEIIRKHDGLNTLFSVSQTVLCIGLAALTFRAFSPGETFNTVGAFVGLVTSASVLYMVNSVAVALAAGLQMSKNPIQIWFNGTKQSVAQEVALTALGFIGAIVVTQVPWALPLLVIPVVVIYVSFKRLIHLNEQVANQLQELKVTQTQLVESARMASVGIMVAGIAHQINNPVFVIRGRAETLLADGEKHLKSEQSKKYIQVIYDMSDRVGRVVKSLLPVTQLTEDGKARASIDECVQNALSMLESKIHKTSVKLNLELAPGLPAILGEGCEIQEIVINLIDNACNAMTQGGNLTLQTKRVDDTVMLRVIDTGGGISTENIDKIFSPFFSTRKGGGGVGLGLYVARHIAQKHGGQLTVSSEAGKGSVFCLTLCVVPANSNSTPS
ncbi:MAG: sensor histidine kinase [Dehalogenimonas sp.]